METLSSARDTDRQMRRLVALAIAACRRASNDLQVAALIAFFQAEAIGLMLASTAAILVEQGIPTTTVGRVLERSLVTDVRDLRRMVLQIDGQASLDRLVGTMVQDAGRTATTVDIGRRPPVTAHVRMLDAPSCPRCAVLAGRIYRWSSGFERHPQCDCFMIPTTVAAGTPQMLDPIEALRAGQIRGLSKADLEAIDAGADIGQVVNVRRRQAGLVVGSSVMDRAGRPTPAGIMRSAQDREQATALLKRHGYLA